MFTLTVVHPGYAALAASATWIMVSAITAHAPTAVQWTVLAILGDRSSMGGVHGEKGECEIFLFKLK
jgi:hypothetical protein